MLAILGGTCWVERRPAADTRGGSRLEPAAGTMLVMAARRQRVEWRSPIEHLTLEEYAARTGTRLVTAAPPASSDPDMLLPEREVRRRTGLSRSSIYRLERAGDFPRRRRLTSNRVAWRASEIAAWIAARARR